MKKVLIGIFLMCGISYAELYKVNVTRESQDLYRTLEGVYIKTMYCYEYVYYEDAILKYEVLRYSDKLIFNNGNSCDVDRLLN